MSIVTKTGDEGTTALLFNRRVSKCDARVEACGAVDELNAAIGLARATMPDRHVGHRLHGIQEQLIQVMGELATDPRDSEKFNEHGFTRVTPEMTQKLESWIGELEAENITFRGWALPGATVASAALDLARTTCRRGERVICGLRESGGLPNSEVLVFMNRLSDLLWLVARWVESRQTGENQQVLV